MALRCTLVQTGDEKVETRSTAVLSFQETISNQSVVQVHVYKNEAGEKWNVLSCEGINTFLKQLGFSLDAIAQTWSQAFFKGGKKVGAAEADYYHGFVKVENGKLDAILRLGGMTGFLPQPTWRRQRARCQVSFYSLARSFVARGPFGSGISAHLFRPYQI